MTAFLGGNSLWSIHVLRKHTLSADIEYIYGMKKKSMMLTVLEVQVV